MGPQMVHDPFYASNGVAAPPSVQMAGMYNPQHAYMMGQQQQMMMMGPPQPVNPFGNGYGASGQPHPYGPGMPVQPYNPYSGLI